MTKKITINSSTLELIEALHEAFRKKITSSPLRHYEGKQHSHPSGSSREFRIGSEKPIMVVTVSVKGSKSTTMVTYASNSPESFFFYRYVFDNEGRNSLDGNAPELSIEKKEQLIGIIKSIPSVADELIAEWNEKVLAVS